MQIIKQLGTTHAADERASSSSAATPSLHHDAGDCSTRTPRLHRSRGRSLYPGCPRRELHPSRRRACSLHAWTVDCTAGTAPLHHCTSAPGTVCSRAA